MSQNLRSEKANYKQKKQNLVVEQRQKKMLLSFDSSPQRFFCKSMIVSINSLLVLLVSVFPMMSIVVPTQRVTAKSIHCPILAQEGSTNTNSSFFTNATTFTLSSPTKIQLEPYLVTNTNSNILTVCLLGLEQPTTTIENVDGIASKVTPIARFYDNGSIRSWERSGGTFAKTLTDWSCNNNTNACTTTLPLTTHPNRFVVETKSVLVATIVTPELRAQVARFLESASFGATKKDIDLWISSGQTFEKYLTQQFDVSRTGITSHREYFRRRANARWSFQQPEFGGQINPCQGTVTTWNRDLLTVKDRDLFFDIRRIRSGIGKGRIQFRINKQVRSLLKQLTALHTYDYLPDEVTLVNLPDGRYKIVSWHHALNRHEFRVRKGRWGYGSEEWLLTATDLIIDFPIDYKPSATLSIQLPSLNDNTVWYNTTVNSGLSYTEHVMVNYSIPSSACRLLPIQNVRVKDVKFPITNIFALTVDGVWLQYDPRIRMNDNSYTNPWRDGGTQSLLSNRTEFCSNVYRNPFNEHSCQIANVPKNEKVCRGGSYSIRSELRPGRIVCGSPGEVSNDYKLGDKWYDVVSMEFTRVLVEQYPVESIQTTPYEVFAQQREVVWTAIALTAPDQLRQRMAFALFHIFSLPKRMIGGEEYNTECFLTYYDILVRNAFGNYRNVLLEMAYSPLMGESLTYVNSKSSLYLYRRDGVYVKPDENFAREVMQLFTIGLFMLNLDGTPVLDEQTKQPIETYTNEHIVSFARVWTGFVHQERRSNAEMYWINRIDPMRIEAAARDRFPKTDLQLGYLGDSYYPLCVDLLMTSPPLVSVGAKYRLLGRQQTRPEMFEQEYDLPPGARRIQLQKGTTGLYEQLCNASIASKCTYPGVIVLDETLLCATNATECLVEIVRFVQVDEMFYEYIRPPCVEHTFYNNPQMIQNFADYYEMPPMCANPLLPVAGPACCGMTDNIFAGPGECLDSSERMTQTNAQKRCGSEKLCNFQYMYPTTACPSQLYRWTSEPCIVQVKIRSSDGFIAIVHNAKFGKDPVYSEHPHQDWNENYFGAYWKEPNQYPMVSKSQCQEKQPDGSSAACTVFDDSSCICDIIVKDKPVFTSLPVSAAEIIKQLRIGYPNQKTNTNNKFLLIETNSDYRYYSTDPSSCCNSDTIFEVTDSNGRIMFLKNIQSMVEVVSTKSKKINATTASNYYMFRNPVQFNSIIYTEVAVSDAHYETMALLDHLLYHPSTPPFLANQFIQRIGGISNPSPNYIHDVAMAFKSGHYESNLYKNSNPSKYGTGIYGDLEATIAAVLLHPEPRSLTLMELDPSHGSMREPILKVLSFMRVMQYHTSLPAIELNLMDKAIGQMVYEQPSVFSFFRPTYSPVETIDLGLASPETEVMSSGRIIGLLNGLTTMIYRGLVHDNDGFGVTSWIDPWGKLEFVPTSKRNYSNVVRELSELLTGGRMNQEKQGIILKSISTYYRNNTKKERTDAFHMALRYMITAPEFHSTAPSTRLLPSSSSKVQQTSTSNDSTLPPATSTTATNSSNKKQKGYKAIIHLALLGAADSFNILVPRKSGCDTLVQQYESIRGDLSLSDDQRIPLDGDFSTTQPCSSFDVHSELPIVQKLFNEEDLLFVANAGVLTQPCTNIDCGTKTRTELFAHNRMQDEVHALDPYEVTEGTATLGRMATVLQEQYGYRTSRTVVEATPTSLSARSPKLSGLITVDEAGVKPLIYYDSSTSSITTNSSIIEQQRSTIYQLNAGGGSTNDTSLRSTTSGSANVYNTLWSQLLRRSIEQTDQLSKMFDTTQTNQTFPYYGLGLRMKRIAQLIANRNEKRNNMERDFFFVSLDGWDTHLALKDSLDSLLKELNIALEPFINELKYLGVWDDVVIVQTSEFGRQLTPNSGGGTDHGWGGHYWVSGGSVSGKRIIGEYPNNITDDSPYVYGSGRIIPTTSFDSIFHGLAQWTGIVNDNELEQILPNKNNFPSLFNASDLFVL